MLACAMSEYLLAATPHTLACHLTSLSHLFFSLTTQWPPPDASHLLITPANLVEVRAQAAKSLPRLLSAPAAFHFFFFKGCQIWARVWGGGGLEGDGQTGRDSNKKKKKLSREQSWYLFDGAAVEGETAEDGTVGELDELEEQQRA